MTLKGSTLKNGLFKKKMSNVCFYTLMKHIRINFQLSTSIIVVAIVENKFWPFREVPLKMDFFQKLSNVPFYTLMKPICSKFYLFTSIIVASLVKTSFDPFGEVPLKIGRKNVVLKLPFSNLNSPLHYLNGDMVKIWKSFISFFGIFQVSCTISWK